MLSREENEFISRVGPGTPMGEVFRRFWIPALLSEEIPKPDCPPVRVRLLGEDLVAFRDSQGRLGLLDEHCPHRRASLYYGRNGECGLRCVYHGWKFDIEGNVLETPAEPPGSTLKDKVHQIAYPCREASRVVFTYMGPKEKMPLFPNYEWLSLPTGHVKAFKTYLECNYLQSLEGDCDPAHLTFLHRGNPGWNPSSYALAPSSYDVEETRFGLRTVVIKKPKSGTAVRRVTNFVMPFIGCVEVGYRDGFMAVYPTPSDDTHTTRYNFRFKKSEPMSEDEVKLHSTETRVDHTLIGNRLNDYLMDRENQRTTNYTGMEGFTTQDASMTESMGPICDRTKEHLGVSDTYIIALRRVYFRQAKAIKDGKDPQGLVRDPDQNDFSDIKCLDSSRPPDTSL